VHDVAVEWTDLGDECASTYAQQKYRAVEGESGHQHKYRAHDLGRTREIPKPLTQPDLVEFGNQHCDTS
jgi:hypothetical protein